MTVVAEYPEYKCEVCGKDGEKTFWVSSPDDATMASLVRWLHC